MIKSEHPELLGVWRPKTDFAFLDGKCSAASHYYDGNGVLAVDAPRPINDPSTLIHEAKVRCFRENKPILLDLISFLERKGHSIRGRKWRLDIFRKVLSFYTFKDRLRTFSVLGEKSNVSLWHTDRIVSEGGDLFIWSDRGGTQTLAGKFSEDDFDQKVNLLKKDVPLSRFQSLKTCRPCGAYFMKADTVHRPPPDMEWRVFMRMMPCPSRFLSRFEE